jgi:iron complex transport system ATP-binding protein
MTMNPKLEIRDLSVARGGITILEKVTFSLDSGQMVALIGPNGAGKSTLLSAIAGYIPYQGSIFTCSKGTDPNSMAYMPQLSESVTSLAVIEVVLLGRFDELGLRIKDQDLAEAQQIIEDLGLRHLTYRPLDTLSGGQRQMVYLAQRLIRKPDILLLDEATSALDLRHQLEVIRRLRDYISRTGALVILAVHDLNLALRHADQILVLSGGRLAALGRGSEVLTDHLLRSAFGIEAQRIETDDGNTVILPLMVASHES